MGMSVVCSWTKVLGKLTLMLTIHENQTKTHINQISSIQWLLRHFNQNHIRQPHFDIKGKIRGSSKSIGFILWQRLMTIILVISWYSISFSLRYMSVWTKVMDGVTDRPCYFRATPLSCLEITCSNRHGKRELNSGYMETKSDDWTPLWM